MHSSVAAPIVRKFRTADLDFHVGRHWVDETVVIRVSGTVERHDDQRIAPTISILLVPTSAVFRERLGVEKDAAMSVLREAIAEAMQAKTNQSPSIESEMNDAASAVAAVKRDPIEELPKMRRAGLTDVSDPKVSVSAATSVSDSLCTAARLLVACWVGGDSRCPVPFPQGRGGGNATLRGLPQ